MSERGLDVGFTEVLYGVVVANAIYELSFGVTVRNYMLLFAVALVVDDWIEYQADVGRVEPTPANYARALVVDVIILVVWYFLTIVPADRPSWYFAIAGAFFALQAVWNLLVPERPVRELVRGAHLQLAGAFLLLAWAARYVDAVPLLVLAALVFVGRKAVVWRRIADSFPS